jgi:hypothetical protein
MTQLKITKEYPFSKVGINEVQGLKILMRALVRPVLTEIKSRIYWDDNLDAHESEYKSRDGFIAYSHNCGGFEIWTIIPKCESTFTCLEYGECDGEYCDNHDNECAVESEGHLDAKLRIWFKFEGINAQGEMEFYLYLGGGNGDAPYFRTKYEHTIFERSFTAKSLTDLKRKGKIAIRMLIKAMV